MVQMPDCEVKIRGQWQRIMLEQARGLDAGRVKRRPECHGRVRAYKASSHGMSAHFEHFEQNSGCNNLGDVSTAHQKSIERLSHN
jgi:hypothetical protein